MTSRSRGLGSGSVWPARVKRRPSWGTSSQVKTASIPGTFFAISVLISCTMALAWGECRIFTIRQSFGARSSV